MDRIAAVFRQRPKPTTRKTTRFKRFEYSSMYAGLRQTSKVYSSNHIVDKMDCVVRDMHVDEICKLLVSQTIAVSIFKKIPPHVMLLQLVSHKYFDFIDQPLATIRQFGIFLTFQTLFEFFARLQPYYFVRYDTSEFFVSAMLPTDIHIPRNQKCAELVGHRIRRGNLRAKGDP